jgi:glycosyltransferase involved in cell wall biosynthesis
MKIGIFDHLSLRVGGAQLVVAQMAANLSQTHQVDVIHSGKGYTLASLARSFDLDLSGVRERIIPDSLGSFSIPGKPSTWHYLTRGIQANRHLTRPYDLFIYSGHGSPPFCFAKKGIAYCHFPFEGKPSQSVETLRRSRQRSAVDRGLRLLVHDCLWWLRMRRYGTVLANSEYTAAWIQKLWGRKAPVLYPPVSVQVPPGEKRNVIATLGRFINTDTKNHALQVSMFKKFLDLCQEGWRLDLIGFCTDLPQDRAYLEQLRKTAQGLPVRFIVNAERKVVLDCLAETKIFWHTTALGEEGNLPPEAAEHFGIATVEAMAAGCVPLVPTSGGQPEIVHDGVSGFLCRSTEAVIQCSARLAKDDNLRAGMAQRAKERSQQFGPIAFAKGLHELVSSY